MNSGVSIDANMDGVSVKVESSMPQIDDLFNKSVEQATNIAVNENKPLLVYVTNNCHLIDEQVQQLFVDENARALVETYFVPVKLWEGSVDFGFFYQLFKVRTIPSLCVVKDAKMLDTILLTKQNVDDSDINDAGGAGDTLNTSDIVARLSKLVISDSDSPEPVFLSGKIVDNLQTCTLSFRLLDGRTIQKQFDASETLNDARQWLDTQSGVDIVPVNSLPSFARPDGLNPTRYAFQSPSIPRITFDDQHEFMTLSGLDLCPRSVLILKPLFDESVNEAYEHNRSVLRNLNTTVTRFCNAIYSFFDYGVDESTELNNHAEKSSESTKVLSINDVGNDTKPANFINFEHKPGVTVRDDSSPELSTNNSGLVDTAADVKSSGCSPTRNNATAATSSSPLNPELLHASIMKELDESRGPTPLKTVVQHSMTRVETINDDDDDEK